MQFFTGCTAQGASTLKLNNAGSQDYLVMWTVNSVFLPDFVNSFFVVATSYQSSGTVIETSGATALKMTTSAQSLAVTLTPTSMIVADYTNLQINTVTTLTVPSTGQLEFDFPKWNAGTQTLGLETSYFNLQLLNYNGVSNTYTLPCTSALNPGLICSLSVGNANTVEEISTTFDSVIIRSFSSDFTSLSVSINSNVFRNPPSTRAITNIDALQFNSAGYLQQQQTSIKLQVTQGATMPVSNAEVSAFLGNINAQDTYTFTFDLTLPLPVGAVIQIKIPPQVRLVSSTDSNSIILNSVNGYDPVYMVPQVKITNQSTQTIIITNLVPTSDYYVDAGNFIKFDLIYLTNPGSIKTTDPFNITFYDEDNIIMTVQPGPTLTATPGKFQSVYVEPENYRVRQETPYKFGFVTLNGIGVDSKVVIKVPIQIGVIPGNLFVEGVTTMSPNTNIQVSYDSINNQIIISNCYTQSYLYPTLVEFIITSGIENADDTQPCSPFIISTTDKDGGLIDSGYSESLTFSANTIQEIITTACADKQTASVTEDVCTYKLQFMIGAQWPILSGSYIVITLPDDLELFDSSITARNSSTQGVSDLSSSFAVQQNLKTIIVSNAFQLSSAPNGIDYRQDSFAVNIAGIVSPRTTAPTLSFVAKIYSSDDYLQYDKLQGVYSNVYEARMFTKAVIKRDNEVNGEFGTYNFTLQFSSRVFKKEYIKLTPPDTISITIGMDNQCVGLRLLSPSLTCTIIDGSLYVLIMPANATVNYFEPGAIVQFQVHNVSNPLSLEPTLSYKIYIATDTIQNFYVNQMVQGLSLLNVYDGQLLNVQVLPDSSQFGQQTDYSIYFTTANIIPAKGYVQIIFPQGYYTIYNNISCSAIKNVYQGSYCSLVDVNTIQLSNAFIYSLQPGQEVGFKIRNIINPNESVNATVISKDFFITTYTPFDYSIDQTSNLNFTIGCNFPCNSCDKDQSVCTSCQKVSGMQLFLYQSSCSATCPVGYFANSNYVCQQCNYPCAQCNTQKDFCDSCLTTSGLPYAALNGQCYKDCPEGSFANPSTLTCDPCVNSCATCLNQGECLSCTKNTYFTDGQCVDSCPNTSIKFDSDEVLECLDCKSPCVTCNTTIDTCTSCIVGTYLYQSTCVEKCPTTWLPNEQNVCYQASQFRLPFIMMLGTLIIAIVVFVSHKKYPAETKPLSAYLGLQISWMVLFWIWSFGWYVSDSYRASATVTGLAVIANYIINYWWFEYYKARIMQNDQLYRQYKDANPKWQKAIIVCSLMTSFQLFRLSYCRLFDCAGMNAQLENRQKFFKKMNRLTHFQLTFVFLPTVIAAIYNLFYTWYGRQCFWNDIENIIQCAQTMTLMILVLFRSQIHYIGLITKEEELAVEEKHDFRAETKQVQTIADHIAEDGFEKQRGALKDLTPETRMDVITGLFNRLVKGKQLQNKKIVGGTETPFVTAHGQKTQKFNTAFQENKAALNLSQQPQKYDKVSETNITGVINTDMNLTEMNNFDDTQKMPLKQADQLGQDQEANGPGARSKGGKKQFLEGDEELFNFQSAPLNAKSALKGNLALQERYSGLLKQLEAVRKKKTASKAGGSRGRSKTSQAAQDSEDEDLSFEKEQRDHGDQLTERMKQYLLPEDSDDVAEKFTSEKYGEGTSKVVAAHYNTIQAQTGIQKGIKSKFNKDKGQTQNHMVKHTAQEMQEIVDEIKKAQAQKIRAKARVDDFEGQKDVIADNFAKTKAKNIEVQGMIKDLEVEIAAEIMRLEKVRHLKDQDVQFVENAFYTSNEDGMGVSPSAYTNQNAIPRPATKMREPPRIPPFGEQHLEQIIQEDQILREAERSSSRTRTKRSYQDANMVAIDLGRGKSGHSGRAETLESARKKSGQSQNKDSLPNIKKIISSASTKMRKKKGPRSNNSNHAANLQISDNSSSQIELKGRNRNKSKLDASSRSKSKQGKKTADFGALGSSENKSQGNARQKGVLLTSSSNQLEAVRSPNETKHRRPGTKSKGETSPRLSKISEGGRSGRSEGMRKKMSETARSGLNLSNDRIRSQLGVINEVGKEKLSGLRRGSLMAKHLKMKPIVKERDGLEYVTSEDSQGRPIKKLKKVQRPKGILVDSLSSHRNDSLEDSMEYYTSEDLKGNRVQKLRRKEKKSGLSSIQERGRKKIKSVKRQSDQSEPKNGRSLGARVVNTQPFDFTRAPRRSTEHSLEDRQAVAGRADQSAIALQNRAIKKLSGLPQTKSQDRIRAGTNPSKQDTNYKLNQLAGITTSTFNGGESYLRGQSTLQDAGLMQTQNMNRMGNKPTLVQQPPPDYTMTTLSDQKKPKKKKKSQPPVPQRDFGGVYFNHTQFERAVIATNGRAPYNNQEVEKLSKHKIESMTKDSFKNNWINQLILKEQAQKSPREVVGSPRSHARHQSQLSASQTARTVFKGRPEAVIDNNNILFGSVNQTDLKQTAPRKKTSPVPVRDPRLQTEVKEEQFLVSSNIADDEDALPIYRGPQRK